MFTVWCCLSVFEFLNPGHRQNEKTMKKGTSNRWNFWINFKSSNLSNSQNKIYSIFLKWWDFFELLANMKVCWNIFGNIIKLITWKKKKERIYFYLLILDFFLFFYRNVTCFHCFLAHLYIKEKHKSMPLSIRATHCWWYNLVKRNSVLKSGYVLRDVSYHSVL